MRIALRGVGSRPEAGWPTFLVCVPCSSFPAEELSGAADPEVGITQLPPQGMIIIHQSALEPAKWEVLIREEMSKERVVHNAHRYIRCWKTDAKPALIETDDGAFVVKGGNGGRRPVNDHIVARLGAALGAPVPAAGYVKVSRGFIESVPDLMTLVDGQPMEPGMWHGTRWLHGVSEEEEGHMHLDVPDNRERFAVLAVLYGWTSRDDEQFLYSKLPPRIVWSHDHTHFFPKGPDWTIASLTEAPRAEPDQKMITIVKCTKEELDAATLRLRRLDAARVVTEAVSAPLESWPITMEERVALASFLFRRHQELASTDAFGDMQNN
jgi:hypothetical protein